MGMESVYLLHHALGVREGGIQELDGVPVGVVAPVLPVLDDAVQRNLQLAVTAHDGDQFLSRGIALPRLQEAEVPKRIHRSLAGKGADVSHHGVRAAAAQEEIVAGASFGGGEGHPVLPAPEFGGRIVVPVNRIALHGMEEGDGDFRIHVFQMVVFPALVQALAFVLAQAVDGLIGIQQEGLVDFLARSLFGLFPQERSTVGPEEGIDGLRRVQLHAERIGGEPDNSVFQFIYREAHFPGFHAHRRRGGEVGLPHDGRFHHLNDVRRITDHFEAGHGSLGTETVFRPPDRSAAGDHEHRSRKR